MLSYSKQNYSFFGRIIGGGLFAAYFAFLLGEGQAGTHYVAQADPKLTMDPRLATNSCLSLPSDRITNVNHQPGLKFSFFVWLFICFETGSYTIKAGLKLVL